MDLLEWLQGWYRSQCNGDWEHCYELVIETLDNPGWSISIPLEGTSVCSATMTAFLPSQPKLAGETLQAVTEGGGGEVAAAGVVPELDDLRFVSRDIAVVRCRLLSLRASGYRLVVADLVWEAGR
jgi:hypothetical protein